MTAEIDLVLTSEDDLPQLSPAVDSFCVTHALSPRTTTALNLVLEELVTNVFLHGVGPTGARITVRTVSDGETLRGEVRDDGQPFDPLGRHPLEVDLRLEDREIGGLGIHMVRSLARDLSYAREGEENVTRFSLAMRRA